VPKNTNIAVYWENKALSSNGFIFIQTSLQLTSVHTVILYKLDILSQISLDRL